MKLLPTGYFARSISVLAGGTAAGQVLVVAATPLLTRLYSPEDFGLLAIYSSLLGVCVVIASLRYQLSIPLPESDEDAVHAVALGWLIVIGISGIVLAFLALFKEPFTEFLNAPKMEQYIWLLPVGIFLSGTYQVLRYWAIRKQEFPRIAKTKISQAVSMLAMQIGASTLGPIALILGRVLGQGSGVIGLGWSFIRTSGAILRNVEIKKLCSVAFTYRQFPLYSTWSAALNTAGRELPPVIITAFFGPAPAGLYFLTMRVFLMPVGLVSDATASVFLSKAPISNREGRLDTLVIAVEKKLLKIFVLPTFTLIVIAPQLFEVALGEQFRESGYYAQILYPWVLLMALSNPISPIIGVLQREKAALYFEITLAITRICGLIVGCIMNSLLIAVALFSGAAMMVVGSKLIWMLWESGALVKSMLKAYLEELILVVGAAVLLSISSTFEHESVFYLVIVAMLAYSSCRAYTATLQSS